MPYMMLIGFWVLNLSLSPAVFAVCPICTFTVGAGIGLSQYFGIDDAITGLWVGGCIVSFIILTKNWMEKKNIRFYGYRTIVVIGYYGSILIPLYLSGFVGHELNQLWGFDKILLGIFVGSLAFWIGALSYEQLKKNNNNHAYFPFQKVIMPIFPLVILSMVFYILTK
ncbi:MAG: hypothetical protein KKE11_03090 [Gammaproteobacteria bacterium]|nr:hypothetical protein [Gammaproteobacteria bacterium]